MRPESVTANGYGAKAMAILTMASVPRGTTRVRIFQSMCDQFSPKSIMNKCHELAQRGYITTPVAGQWDQASLTDKGRQTLETLTMRG